MYDILCVLCYLLCVLVLHVTVTLPVGVIKDDDDDDDDKPQWCGIRSIFFCNRVLISGILYLRLLTSQVLRPDFKAAAIDGTD